MKEILEIIIQGLMGATDLVLCHVHFLPHWCPSSASYSEQRHCHMATACLT